MQARSRALDQLRLNPDPIKVVKYTSSMLPPLFDAPLVEAKALPTCSIAADEAEQAAEDAAVAEAAEAEAAVPRHERGHLAIPLKKSASLPAKLHKSNYRPLRGIIYGGSDYARANREGRGLLPPAKPRYLNHLSTEEETLSKARLRKKRAQQQKMVKEGMRESAAFFDSADRNRDGTLDFDEFCRMIQLQLNQNGAKPVAAGLQKKEEVKTRAEQLQAAKTGGGMPGKGMLLDWFRLCDYVRQPWIELRSSLDRA